MGRLRPGALTEAVAASGWPALADVFRHIVSGYDGWLHEMLGAGPVLVERPGDVAEWQAFEGWRTQTRASFRRMLDSTPDAELFVPRVRAGGDGDAGLMMSVADVLAHLLLHERGHHGDITTLLSQLGVEPPALDYAVYLYFKRRQSRT